MKRARETLLGSFTDTLDCHCHMSKKRENIREEKGVVLQGGVESQLM